MEEDGRPTTTTTINNSLFEYWVESRNIHNLCLSVCQQSIRNTRTNKKQNVNPVVWFTAASSLLTYATTISSPPWDVETCAEFSKQFIRHVVKIISAATTATTASPKPQTSNRFIVTTILHFLIDNDNSTPNFSMTRWTLEQPAIIQMLDTNPMLTLIKNNNRNCMWLPLICFECISQGKLDKARLLCETFGRSYQEIATTDALLGRFAGAVLQYSTTVLPNSLYKQLVDICNINDEKWWMCRNLESNLTLAADHLSNPIKKKIQSTDTTTLEHYLDETTQLVLFDTNPESEILRSVLRFWSFHFRETKKKKKNTTRNNDNNFESDCLYRLLLLFCKPTSTNDIVLYAPNMGQIGLSVLVQTTALLCQQRVLFFLYNDFFEEEEEEDVTNNLLEDAVAMGWTSLIDFLQLCIHQFCTTAIQQRLFDRLHRQFFSGRIFSRRMLQHYYLENSDNLQRLYQYTETQEKEGRWKMEKQIAAIVLYLFQYAVYQPGLQKTGTTATIIASSKTMETNLKLCRDLICICFPSLQFTPHTMAFVETEPVVEFYYDDVADHEDGDCHDDDEDDDDDDDENDDDVDDDNGTSLVPMFRSIPPKKKKKDKQQKRLQVSQIRNYSFIQTFFKLKDEQICFVLDTMLPKFFVGRFYYLNGHHAQRQKETPRYLIQHACRMSRTFLFLWLLNHQRGFGCPCHQLLLDIIRIKNLIYFQGLLHHQKFKPYLFDDFYYLADSCPYSHSTVASSPDNNNNETFETMVHTNIISLLIHDPAGPRTKFMYELANQHPEATANIIERMCHVEEINDDKKQISIFVQELISDDKIRVFRPNQRTIFETVFFLSMYSETFVQQLFAISHQDQPYFHQSIRSNKDGILCKTFFAELATYRRVKKDFNAIQHFIEFARSPLTSSTTTNTNSSSITNIALVWCGAQIIQNRLEYFKTQFANLGHFTGRRLY